MESIVEKTISSNAHKGRLAIEWVITRISNETNKTITSAINDL